MSIRFLCLRGAVALLALAVPWSARGARLLSAATCSQAAAGGSRCAQSSDQIPWESPEVHAFVLVGEARPATVVKVVWVSVDAIEPPNYVIQTDERKVGAEGGEVPLLFTIAKDEWPAGRYRIDLSVDGKVERSLTFSVRKASAGGKGAGTPVAKWQPKETRPDPAPPSPPPPASARIAPSPPAADGTAPAAPPASRPPSPDRAAGAPASGGAPPPAPMPSLTGSWVAQGPFGYLTLDFPSPGTLVLGGQSYFYTQNDTALRVLEEGVPADYPYTLRDGVLTLLFPQGYSLAFRRSSAREGASPPAARPESLLWGVLCTGPVQGAYGATVVGWSEYNGTGEFVFGQDSGLPYGRVTQGGGTYAVQGETVQLFFVDGSQGAAQVVSRLPDGRISGLAFGEVVYLSGLCP